MDAAISGQRATLRRRQTTFRWVAVLLATFLFALPLLGMLDFTTQGPGGVGRTADTWRTLVDVSTITTDYPALRQGFLASIALPTFSCPRMTSELIVPAICSGSRGEPCEISALAVA